MTKTSLRLRLLGLWALSLIACVAVGALLAQLYEQSTTARVGRAEAAIAHGCDLIRDIYADESAQWSGEPPALSDPILRSDLATAVSLALARENGVEGGIWQAEAGPLAYAFPTYSGTGPKTDLPAAERDHIQAVNEEAVRENWPVDRRSVSREQSLLLRACPLSGPIPRLTAWTMIRVEAVPAYDRLLIGLGALLGIHGADVGVARPRADALGAICKRRRGRSRQRRRRERRQRSRRPASRSSSALSSRAGRPPSAS